VKVRLADSHIIYFACDILFYIGKLVYPYIFIRYILSLPYNSGASFEIRAFNLRTGIVCANEKRSKKIKDSCIRRTDYIQFMMTKWQNYGKSDRFHKLIYLK